MNPLSSLKICVTHIIALPFIQKTNNTYIDDIHLQKKPTVFMDAQ